MFKCLAPIEEHELSHQATNWAIQQKGLKPAAKIVLWHLADCHNPSQGCFPSHEYIAEAAEMSVSTVQRHLKDLESAGLISRDRVKRKGKYDRTEYTLKMDAKKPLPVKSTTGQNEQSLPVKSDGFYRSKLPTNLVKEPVKEPSPQPPKGGRRNSRDKSFGISEGARAKLFGNTNGNEV